MCAHNERIEVEKLKFFQECLKKKEICATVGGEEKVAIYQSKRLC